MHEICEVKRARDALSAARTDEARDHAAHALHAARRNLADAEPVTIADAAAMAQELSGILSEGTPADNLDLRLAQRLASGLSKLA